MPLATASPANLRARSLSLRFSNASANTFFRSGLPGGGSWSALVAAGLRPAGVRVGTHDNSSYHATWRRFWRICLKLADLGLKSEEDTPAWGTAPHVARTVVSYIVWRGTCRGTRRVASTATSAATSSATWRGTRRATCRVPCRVTCTVLSRVQSRVPVHIPVRVPSRIPLQATSRAICRTIRRATRRAPRPVVRRTRSRDRRAGARSAQP